MTLTTSLSVKLRELLELISAMRLCPNGIRKKIIVYLGWKIGDRSVVRWGINYPAKRAFIGRDCLVAAHTFFDGAGSVTIEDNVKIGPFSKFLTTTHPIEEKAPRRVFGKDIHLDTKIEFGCWLGASVMVLPGVTIRSGCVIAAGAVVVKDTEPNGIYAGVPAKRVKDLAPSAAVLAPIYTQPTIVAQSAHRSSADADYDGFAGNR